MKKLLSVALLALSAACSPPSAPRAAEQEVLSGALEVRDAWAAATPGGAEVAAGYLTIVNGAPAADRLVSASSPRAARVEIHEMRMDGDVMRMRAMTDGLALASGARAELAPGGAHLMFMDISAPFLEGESVPVTLVFENSGALELMLPVRAGGAHGGH